MNRWSSRVRERAGWRVARAAVLVLAALLVVPGCLIKLPQSSGLAGVDADVAVQGDGVIPLPDGGTRRLDNLGEGLADYAWTPPPQWDSWGIPDSLPPGDWSTGGEADAGSTEQAWSCYYPLEEIVSEPLTSSFVVDDLDIGAQDKLYVYGFLCGIEEATSAVPEQYFPLLLDSPTDMVATLSCSKPCYMFLMKNGCLYDSTVACWHTGESKLQAEATLMPGLYLLGVEFPAPADVPFDPSGLQFDLHAALNREYGQSSCTAEENVQDSQIPTQCKTSQGVAAKSKKVFSSLAWSAMDDFDLHCSQGGMAADEVGGMPDRAHAYTADFEASQPRLLDVRVEFAPTGGGALPPGRILAVTTAPCGAAEAVLDCTWGHEDALELTGISAFPHETLYAVVDGMGDGAFDPASQSAYELTWTVHETCD